MSAMEALKMRTEPLHRRVEDVPSMRRLFAPDYRLEEYVALLRRLALLYAGLEATLYAGLPADLVAALGPPVRRARLVADLAALGDEEPIGARPREAPSSLAARLGGLYVVEGAALGGRLIHRCLSAHFGGSADRALAFYAGEGDGSATGRRWRRFGAVVADRLDGRPDEIETAVAGAETIFRAFMAAFAD